MFLVFDLETTGLPRMTQNRSFARPKWTKYYDTSRIVSISWTHLDKNYKRMGTNYCLIKPDEFAIPEEATKIHGITNECALQYGVPIKDMFQMLDHSATASSHLVSHNIRFDKSILLSELYRYDQMELLEKISKMSDYCTMMRGKKHLKVRKWPKLGELYQSLFDKEMEGAHDAFYDTAHCTDCFIKLQDLENQTLNLDM